MWLGIGIPKYINIHKSWYKFARKINKCDEKIKPIITKKTPLVKEKMVETIKESIEIETNWEREREREREREYWPFLS